jgi:hypothetical protein
MPWVFGRRAVGPPKPKKMRGGWGRGGALLCTLHRRMAHAWWPRRRHAPRSGWQQATATGAKNWLRGRARAACVGFIKFGQIIKRNRSAKANNNCAGGCGDRCARGSCGGGCSDRCVEASIRWGHRSASVGAAVRGPVGAAVRALAIGGGCVER